MVTSQRVRRRCCAASAPALQPLDSPTTRTACSTHLPWPFFPLHPFGSPPQHTQFGHSANYSYYAYYIFFNYFLLLLLSPVDIAALLC